MNEKERIRRSIFDHLSKGGVANFPKHFDSFEEQMRNKKVRENVYSYLSEGGIVALPGSIVDFDKVFGYNTDSDEVSKLVEGSGKVVRPILEQGEAGHYRSQLAKLSSKGAEDVVTPHYDTPLFDGYIRSGSLSNPLYKADNDKTATSIPYAPPSQYIPMDRHKFEKYRGTVNVNGVAEQVDRQHNKLQKKLSEVYAEENRKRIEQDNRDRRDNPFLYYFTKAFDNSEKVMVANERYSNAKISNLKSAIHALDDTKGLITEARKSGTNDDHAIYNFGRGVRDVVSKPSTWDFGASDLADSGDIHVLSKKIELGKTLTPEESELATSLALQLASEQLYADRISTGYRVGGYVGESMPFILEMALNPVTGTGTAIGKIGTKALIKKGGSALAKSAIGKVARYSARVAGDIAGSAIMTGTTGLQKVFADTNTRMAGRAEWKYDDNGVIILDGFTDRKDGLESFTKAFGSKTIENFSEMVGGYFAPLLKGGANIAVKGISKMGLTKVSDTLTKIPITLSSSALIQFLRKAQYHGPLVAYAEELVGTGLNALTVGDSKWSDIVDGKQQLETFLSVSITGGFFSAINTLNYGVDRLSVNKKTNEAKLQLRASNSYEEYSNIEEDIKNSDDVQLVDLLSDINKNANVSQKFKRDAVLYAGRLKAQQYSTIAGIKMDEEGVSDPLLRQEAKAIETGYRLAELDVMTRKVIANSIRKNLKELNVDNNIELDNLRERSNKGDDISAELEIYNSNMVLSGLYRGMYDNTQNEKAVMDERIDNMVNESRGGITFATLKNDNSAFILLSGGLSDNDNAVVMNIKDGNARMIVSSELSGVSRVVPSDLVKQDAFAKIDRRYQQEVENVTTPIPVQENEEYVDADNNAVVENIEGHESVPTLFNVNGMIVPGVIHGKTAEGNTLIQFDTSVEINEERGCAFEFTDSELASMQVVPTTVNTQEVNSSNLIKDATSVPTADIPTTNNNLAITPEPIIEEPISTVPKKKDGGGRF